MDKIYLGGQAIGEVRVERRGLYYRFECRCDLSGEVVCRIQAVCGENAVNLGIPVPENGVFALRTQIPVKHLGEGKLTFRAIPKGVEKKGIFIPLAPEEPFRYLRRLEDAFLQVRDGQVGIVMDPQ